MTTLSHNSRRRFQRERMVWRMGVVCVLVAIGTLFGACSERKPDPVRRGPHPVGFTDPRSENFHGLRVRDPLMGGNATCLSCHTVVATDSTSDAVAMSCANSPGCHATSEHATQLACGTCHARADLSPSHGAHFAAGTDACALCHAATYSATGALVDSVHMNAVIDVVLSSETRGVFNATDRTCSDSGCHGITMPNTSPAWGVAANLTCESCHAIDALSNAHRTHFALSAADCGVCHATTAIDGSTLQPDTRTHANLEVNVALIETHGGTFDADAATCSGTYCHGTTVTTPSWGDDAGLTCQSCHAFTELPGAHGAHLGMNDDCSLCHAMTASSATAISNPAFHGNLVVDVVLSSVIGGEFNSVTQTCATTTCHGAQSPVWSATADLTCNSCHAKAELPGAHQAHFARSPATCETCHHETAQDSSAIKNPALHLNFTVDVALSDDVAGTYDHATETCSDTYCHLGATPTPAWNGTTALRCGSCHVYAELSAPHPTHTSFVSNDCSVCHNATASGPYAIRNPQLHADNTVQVVMNDAVGGTFDSVTKTCSDTYCHVTGTPTWAADLSLNCNSCHAKATLPGAHQAHIAHTPATCETCHSATVSGSWTIIDPGLHMNYVADVVLVDGIGGTYDASTRTCSNTYCHRDATPTPAWDGDTALRCGSCHPYAALPEPHPVHIALVENDCSVCHNATASGPYTLSNPALHADQIVQVAMNDVFGGTFDVATNTCANNWCHGPRNDVLSPAWGGATGLDCQGCHPTASLSGGHEFHAVLMGQPCEACHNATALSGTELRPDAPHIDGVVQVVGTYANMVYEVNTNTCSSEQNACHKPGPSKNWFTLE